MSEIREYWAAAAVVDWSNVQVEGLPLPLEAAPKLGNRFLPIFDKREDAEAAFPGVELWLVRVKEEEG